MAAAIDLISLVRFAFVVKYFLLLLPFLSLSCEEQPVSVLLLVMLKEGGEATSLKQELLIQCHKDCSKCIIK